MNLRIRSLGGGKLEAWAQNGVHQFVWRFDESTLQKALNLVTTTAGSGGISWAQAAHLTKGMRYAVHELAQPTGLQAQARFAFSTERNGK